MANSGSETVERMRSQKSSVKCFNFETQKVHNSIDDCIQRNIETDRSANAQTVLKFETIPNIDVRELNLKWCRVYG